ncbi:hypothetical protein DdX_10513 [Ditylenchus destructor]|uniref:Uncharacterized protein n=1 Tax=Ditylenchus destructor TaxID=166010 RepID=A0AAD4R257_9BILA|nr:hypothetical protein DdX_10513 [Ditylenchus destructor]
MIRNDTPEDIIMPPTTPTIPFPPSPNAHFLSFHLSDPLVGLDHRPQAFVYSLRKENFAQILYRRQYSPIRLLANEITDELEVILLPSIVSKTNDKMWSLGYFDRRQSFPLFPFSSLLFFYILFTIPRVQQTASRCCILSLQKNTYQIFIITLQDFQRCA